MSKISHILLPNPEVVPTGTTLVEASKLMKKNKITSVLISKNGRLAGIISVEDVMQCVAERTNLDISVEEIMHSPELIIDSEKWLMDAIAMFGRCKASHITVVENGEKVGIIRAEDILHTYRFMKMEVEK
ncbi:MAG: CBS domain-containing protein [Candidatus Methanoperedens sp.]|nr:CBS domain-containing protein [Candidatus Methanoperedens sp.]MCE8427265.1 CBS domain-containing protein [Candidatus Methanoperedens sp.]